MTVICFLGPHGSATLCSSVMYVYAVIKVAESVLDYVRASERTPEKERERERKESYPDEDRQYRFFVRE